MIIVVSEQKTTTTKTSKVTEPSMVTHTWDSCSTFTHPKCTHTHTHQWTHTHREHTPGAVGSHLCCGSRGAVGGFGALLKGTSVVVLRVESAVYSPPPTYNSYRHRDSISQPLDYKSDSLTIKPQLPNSSVIFYKVCNTFLP